MKQLFSFLTLGAGLALSSAALAQPTVTGRAPARHVNNAPVGSSVVLSFSGSFPAGTASNLRVYSAQAGGRKAGAASGGGGSTLTFDPTTDFKPGETVRVTVPASIAGAAGREVYQFTTATGGTGRGNFQPGSTVAVGSIPSSSTLGDVDGDGDLDLLIGNYGAGTVSVRLNDGAGSFSGSTDAPAGPTPALLALADVNGDGDLDLLVGNTSGNTVSVLTNDGAGNFSAPAAVASGNGTYHIAMADVDADGDLDLIAANYFASTLSIQLNDGAGSFSVGQNLATGSGPYSLATGDVDADGDLDFLVTLFNSTTASLYLNDGAGTFAAGPAVGVGASPIEAALGDIDGDGDLDFLAANLGSNTVSVRLNDGSGVFSGSTNLATGGTPYGLALGDVDADGDLDVLVSRHSTDQVSTWLNNGAGTFSFAQNSATGDGPYSVSLGDLDGDGDLDYVTPNQQANTVSVRLNASAPVITGFAPASGPVGTVVGITGTNLSGVTAVSFNGTAASAFTVNSATSITATVAAGTTTGPLTAATTGFTATSSTNFTVLTSTTVAGIVRAGGAAAPSNAASVSYTVTFADAVTGLGAANFSLSSDGTLAGTSISAVSGSGTTYTVTVNTGTGDGSLRLDLANSAGLSLAVSNAPFTTGESYAIDRTPPNTSIDANPGAITADNTPGFAFSSPDGGVLYNSTGGPGLSFTGNGANSTFGPLADGSYTLGVAAVDAAGNVDPTPAGFSFTVDTQAPTVVISSPASSPTSTSPIPVTVTFSEDVTGFGLADVTVGNGTASNLGGSGSTYTLSVTPAAAGAVTVDVAASSTQDGAANGNAAAPQFSITYALPTVTSWLGGAVGASTDWYTAANWDHGVPTLTLDAVLPAGRPHYPVILAGLARTRTLSLTAGCSLILNGGTLEITGDFVNHGTYSSGGGVVLLSGAAPQALGGASLTRLVNLTVGPAGATLAGETEIRQKLTLNGDLTTNGNSFTLLADASGGTPHTAVVVNSGGVVNGSATVQRYIFAGNPGLGYRHYAPPVIGSTVGDLATTGFTPVVNGLYNTSPTPGQVTPFPTVYAYDQSRLATTSNNLSPFDKGWVSPTALTDPLTLGRGYTVNIAGSALVDFVGTLHNGPLTLPLARNAGPTAAASGLHLVGNPYVASIDWSLVDAAQRPGLDAAMYVFESTGQYTGSYRTYANGIGASPLIATGQGFFVTVSAGQTSGSLTLENADRLTDFLAQPAFMRGGADLRPQLQLSLGAAGAPADQRDRAYLYQQAGATPGFDAELDARKLPNPSGLDLASLAGPEALAINGLPLLTQATVVPLRVRVPAAGQYTLRAEEVLNLPAGAAAYLVDTQTGQRLEVRQLPAAGYAFAVTAAQAAAPLTGRFFLNFVPQAAPLAAAPALTAATVGLYPNPARQRCTVLLPGVAGARQARVELFNALGQRVLGQVAALPAAGAAIAVDVSPLARGVYQLRVQAGSDTVTKRLVME